VQSTTTVGRWLVPALLVCAFVATLAMRVPALRLPLERDEGAYATVAALWMAGELPYRDTFDHKPPLMYLLYMPPLVIGGPDAIAIRVWASLLFGLQLPVVYRVGRIVWTPGTAAFAVLIYAIVGSAFALQGAVFNTEQALMLPALVGLWALLRGIENRRRRWPVLYGLCLGLVSLIKPTVVPLLVPLVLLLRAGGVGGILRNTGVMLGGVVLPWLPVVVVWGVSGAWRDLVFALVTYNRLYAAESARGWDIGAVVNVVAPLGALLIYAVGGAALAGWRATPERQRLALALWTLACLAAAVLSLRGYIHYYYPALPGLALLAAPVIARLVVRRQGRMQTWGVAAALLLAGVLLLPWVRDAAQVSRLDAAAQATRLYGDDGTHYFAAAPAVAAYVASITSPEQPIFVWASEPQVYLFAERRPSSRYIYSYPFDLVPELRTRLVADLQRQPPAVVVLYHGLEPPEWMALARQRGMHLDREIGGFDIWIAPDVASEPND
jgi:4-amino-4-deoxy-L-arabinose transferase-like glycosyltransferase